MKVFALNRVSLTQRHMIFIYWLYCSLQIILDTFVTTLVLIKTQAVSSLILYLVFNFTGAFLGFVGLGLVTSRLKWSVHWNFIRAFALYFLSVIIITIAPYTAFYFYIFAFLSGIALGLFWMTIHSYEINFTANCDRDLYSSVLNGGAQFVGILTPFIATASFFLCDRVFVIPTFSIIFVFFLAITVAAIPFIIGLPQCEVGAVDIKKDTAAFARIDNSSLLAAYYFFTESPFLVKNIVVPFIGLMLLKNVINIGIYETIFAVFSALLVFALSNYRGAHNRIRLMSIALCGIVLANAFLFFADLGIILYIFFSIILVIVRPMYRISQHTIDLHSIDIVSKKLGFFPALLVRETLIWLGRMFMLGIVWVISLYSSDMLAARTTIIFYIIGLFAAFAISRKIMKL